MEQWKILVLGTLRLSLNTDYDRVHELANHHDTIRQMLGHGDWEDKTTYNLQTIKDNLCLFTPEILDEFNQLVVKAGHKLVKKTSQKMGQASFRRKRLNLVDPPSRFVPVVTPLWLKPMCIIRPTSTCS
jgi:hypothetical protein